MFFFTILVSAEALGQGSSNRLVNPGAESGGTEGWEATGFRAARYGESALVPPVDFQPGIEGGVGLGAWLFQARYPQATMRQIVGLGDLATTIDGGGQYIQVGGMLGGAAGSTEGTQMTAQPLRATGAPLGAQVVVGPPTAADRRGQSAVVHCYKAFIAPVGTRALEVRLAPANVNAVTATTADELYVVDARALPPGGEAPGEGPGCSQYVPTPAPPTPRGQRRTCPRQQRARGSQQSPAHPTPVRPAPRPRLRVSCVVLTRTRLSLRVSRPATVRVYIARRTAGSGAATWQRARSVTLRARSAGTMSRRLRTLRPGRYRLTIRARSARARSAKLTLTRTIKRTRRRTAQRPA